ncbi:MAG TPA: dynamin family protein [Methylophilaceae bacterium]
MDSSLSQQISDYKAWRDQLVQSITDYRDWLGKANPQSGFEELRLYDIEQALARDKLVLAFVAEFSRGKTETINALFFSEYEQRLLPSDPGRTTMCPTEIFWDERDEPCIRLLPIETRKSDSSLNDYRKMPQAWSKIRLDTNSPEQMRQAFLSIIAQKEVGVDEARMLGLWDDADEAMAHALQTKGKIDIPVWRHAIINFPHPLLKSGLVILDTPGLNALGAEPELTLNIIANAHAVIFIMATDTGVTKSDMQIWSEYIGNHHRHKVALLNKIDILWDALKTTTEIDAEIASQVNRTARQLQLDASNVFAISAQKALLARIRRDAVLLERSGILKVERMLAESVVGSKHDILRSTLVQETSTLVRNSRRQIQQRLADRRSQLNELQALGDRNRATIEGLLGEVSEIRKHYEASVATFNQGSDLISALGKQLLQRLNQEQLQQLLTNSRAEIGDSWTTAGLNRGIRKLVQHTSQMAREIGELGDNIQQQAEQLYQLFASRHQFEARIPPKLDMSDFNKRMARLEGVTDAFCRDPVNVMTEKHFLIRKFFMGLGRQVEVIFNDTSNLAQGWLKQVLTPLRQQIDEYRENLEKRSKTLMKIHQDAAQLQNSINLLQEEITTLQQQGAMLDKLLLKLMQDAKPRPSATVPVAERI